MVKLGFDRGMFPINTVVIPRQPPTQLTGWLTLILATIASGILEGQAEMTIVKWGSWSLFFGLWLLIALARWQALMAAAVFAFVGGYVAGKVRA